MQNVEENHNQNKNESYRIVLLGKFLFQVLLNK